MKDRTVKQLHDLIFKYTKKWKGILFLGLWKIDFTIRDYLANDRDDGCQTLARTQTDWKYLFSQHEYSYMKLKDMTDKEIEKTVLHELLHVLLNEMGEDGIHHEERIVSHLSIVLSNLNGVL